MKELAGLSSGSLRSFLMRAGVNLFILGGVLFGWLLVVGLSRKQPLGEDLIGDVYTSPCSTGGQCSSPRSDISSFLR